MPETKRKIYMLHQLAASGGTVFTRSVSTIPGTVVLSEIHPDRHLPAKFDPIWQFLTAYDFKREADQKDLDQLFVNSIDWITDICTRESRVLILRDHLQHDFIETDRQSSRLYDVLKDRYDIVRIYLARDPMDVWISWKERGWTNQLTIDAFLERWLSAWEYFGANDSDMRLTYEHFCDHSEKFLTDLAVDMGRVWNPGLLDNMYERSNMTGNSGRGGGNVSLRRTQYEIMPFIDAQQFAQSPVYEEICKKAGYPQFADRAIPKVWRSALGLDGPA